MTQPIRLLLVSKSTGGVATYIRTLVRGLDAEKFSITVACLSENGIEFAEELRQVYGVQAFSLAMNRYKVNPFTDARVLYRLARHMRRNSYDIIHAHASKPGFLTRLAAIGTGIPVLYSPHNFAFHEGSNPIAARIVALLERFAAYFTTRIIAVANHERDLALRFGVGTESLFTVIHTGIDPTPFREPVDVAKQKRTLGVPLDAPVVGVVGRLAEPKLPLDFVRMAAILHEQQPALYFVWLGDGPLEAEARALTTSLGLNDVIHWAGHRPDVPSLLRAFDCFVLPSKWEAFPIVVLEAFATGVPVVAMDNLGTREVIAHDRSGWLVPKGDFQKMAEYVSIVLTRPERADKVRTEAWLQIEQEYTLAKMLSTLEDVYLRVVMKSRNGRTLLKKISFLL